MFTKSNDEGNHVIPRVKSENVSPFFYPMDYDTFLKAQVFYGGKIPDNLPVRTSYAPRDMTNTDFSSSDSIKNGNYQRFYDDSKLTTSRDYDNDRTSVSSRITDNIFMKELNFANMDLSSYSDDISRDVNVVIGRDLPRLSVKLSSSCPEFRVGPFYKSDEQSVSDCNDDTSNPTKINNFTQSIAIVRQYQSDNKVNSKLVEDVHPNATIAIDANDHRQAKKEGYVKSLKKNTKEVIMIFSPRGGKRPNIQLNRKESKDNLTSVEYARNIVSNDDMLDKSKPAKLDIDYKKYNSVPNLNRKHSKKSFRK